MSADGSVTPIEIAPGVELGGNQLPIIAGPCAVESRELVLEAASAVAGMAERLALPTIFKASFDKANRSSWDSFRGLGLGPALEILQAARDATGLPILTDVHLPEQCEPVAEVADVLQIPAFLCRQTDLLVAAARTGRTVNIKKGQFMAPDQLPRAADRPVRSRRRAVCCRHC